MKALLNNIVRFFLRLITSAPQNLIFLDLETNGIAHGNTAILEVAAIDELNFEFHAKPFLSRNTKWDESAAKVHGITEEEARNRTMSQKEVLICLKDALEDRFADKPIICGFNPHFDLRVLATLYEYYKIENPFSHRVHDLNTLSRQILGTDNSTATLNRLGISFDKDKKHSAMYDCELGRQVYAKL